MPARSLNLVLDPQAENFQRHSPVRRLPDILLDRGVITAEDLAIYRSLEARQDVDIRDILLSRAMISPKILAETTALEWRTTTASINDLLPDARLIDQFGAAQCLKNGFVPYRRVGASTLIATSRPEMLARRFEAEPDRFANCHMTIATETDIENALTRVRSAELVKQAETRVDQSVSCRNWNARALGIFSAVISVLTLTGMAFYPRLVFGFVLGWAVFTLFLTVLMKLAGTWLVLRDERARKLASAPDGVPTAIVKLPRVSLLVALFQEEALAAHLIKRLVRLDYPRELLDICLVVEADDHVTRATIEKTDLPNWFRTIPVPPGTIKTKPRALNYALDFCKGSIIGVYDAEDAPAPDQIHQVVRHFHRRGPEVACLQGILDFYNAPTNWLSRCFTIEYASWFRMILPGIQRLGFAIPLGGTTVFFRRSVLEDLGAWDAHNVTEDADLGIRLARRGYRTEILGTVTQEEANCRTLPWIRQRSRWIKGYAMTWAVHMRSPAALWRDLGAWKFLGFQILFLGSLSQVILAPVLWSFWLILLGLPHPFSDVISNPLFTTLAGFFLFSEVLGITISCLALRGAHHRWLTKWVPTLMVYFPLGVLASYKGIWEMMTRPFYWDKTEHGFFPAPSEPATPSNQSQ